MTTAIVNDVLEVPDAGDPNATQLDCDDIDSQDMSRITTDHLHS